MIFVHDKSEEWHDEFKASLFRYFKYLPIDYGSYSKIIRNLNDTLFIQMPASDNLRQLGISGHHEKEVIKPEIEFFYELCSNKGSAIRLSDQRRVILFSTEEFNNILPKITSIPPCLTKIPFSMETVIKEKIISDDNCCDNCEWGSKLIKYRNIVYHIKRMNEIRSIDEIDAKFVKEDFISNIDDIEELLTKLFPVTKSDKDELKKLTIYFLEDNEDDRSDIKKLLEKLGVGNVKACDTPQKLIGNITEPAPDIKKNDAVVLLDMVMLNEEKQGEEVCRNINHYLPLTPIFILSGKKDIFKIANRLVGSKFEAFFQKNNLIGNEIDKNIKAVYTNLFLGMILKAVQRAKDKSKERINIKYNRLGIIVAGYGDFSQRTFGNLLKTIDKINEGNFRGIEVELLGIIEPYWAVKGAAKKHLKEKGLDIPVVNNIEKAREELTGYTGKIIIRDVSSSSQHAKNHVLCKKQEGAKHDEDSKKDILKFGDTIFHFVEKPIALNEDELLFYKEKEHKFCSVLEEIENPAVLTVKEYIDENELSISDLEFWRYSSIAWLQLLEGKRMGVRGGSYMDKSIHDWAVAYFLLNKSTSEKGSHEIIASEIEMFMPFSCDNLLKDFPVYEFMKSDEKPTKELRKAEDLKMTSEVKITTSDSPKNDVIVKMHSSWGGVTESDEQGILKHDGFHLKGALYSKESFGTVDFKVRRHVDYKFIDQELRLGKVTCEENGSDEKITIYFNMLRRDDAGIYPFVKVIRNKSIFSIPLCQREGTSLDRIIEDSLLYFSGVKPISKTGPEMSIFCHEMALECLGKARKSIQKPKDAIEKVQKHALDKKVGVKFFWD
jgi:CheY-like chemotaxis protein